MSDEGSERPPRAAVVLLGTEILLEKTGEAQNELERNILKAVCEAKEKVEEVADADRLCTGRFTFDPDCRFPFDPPWRVEGTAGRKARAGRAIR